MNLEIHQRGARLPESMRQLIRDRVVSAVGRLAPGLQLALVRVDAPVGASRDIRTSVQLVPRRGRSKSLLARAASDNLLGAVGQAAERAARQLRRTRSRWMRRRRGDD